MSFFSLKEDSHACTPNDDDIVKHSSSHDWSFGQDCHSLVGVSNTWNLAVVHIERRQSYSPGMLLFHVSIITWIPLHEVIFSITIEFHPLYHL